MGLFNTIRRAIAWLVSLFLVEGEQEQEPGPVISMWANTYPGTWTHDGVSVYYNGSPVVESWRRATELTLDELCNRLNKTASIPRRHLWTLRRVAGGVELCSVLQSPVLYRGSWWPVHDLIPLDVREQAEEMMK